MSEHAPDGTPDHDTDDVVVEHRPDADRFVLLDGDDVVGLVTYREADGRRDLLHTEVDDAYGGRGLAGRLVEQALQDTRDAGLRVVASCPYVAEWLERHPGRFDDLVDAPPED